MTDDRIFQIAQDALDVINDHFDKEPKATYSDFYNVCAVLFLSAMKRDFGDQLSEEHAASILGQIEDIVSLQHDLIDRMKGR